MELTNTFAIMYVGSHTDNENDRFVDTDDWSGGYPYLTSLTRAKTFRSKKDAIRFSKQICSAFYSIPKNEHNAKYFKIVQIGFEILG